MNKDLDYYDGLPWGVIIDPERQEDGQIIFMASHLEFDSVLGTRGCLPDHGTHPLV